MKRTSITLDDPVYEAGQKIAAKRGFGSSFSAYIGWLINRDADGAITREDVNIQSTTKTPAKVPAKGTKTTKRPTKRGK